MENIFEQFRNNVDWNAIKNGEDTANTRTYKEVPPDNYQVTVDKMELKDSKSGAKMLSIWFKITAGKFTNSMIFYNQTIDEDWKFENACRMLYSLALDAIDTRLEFIKDYREFDNMLKDAEEELDAGKISYEVKYGKTKTGFPTFEIIDSFTD